MLNRHTKALAAVALAWLGSNAYAQHATQPAVAATDCNVCATDCCEPRGGFYGSVGVLFLKDCSNGNPAYSSFDCPYSDGLALSHFTTINAFDGDVVAAPRVEFGWTNGSGTGFRGRFFQFHNSNQFTVIDNLSDTPIDPNAPADGLISVKSTASPLGVQFSSVGNFTDPSVLVFENRIHLQIWDLEATRTTQCGCLDLTWSAGVRYLQVSQEYNAFERLITLPPTPDFSPGSPINQSLRSGHNLNGIGPIFGLEGRHTLWDNLRVYGLGRVGVIFSEGGQQAHYLANFNPEFQIDPMGVSVSVDRYRTITTGEVEVGAEYGFELSKSSELYVRGGLVGMVFCGVGNSSRSTIGAPAGEVKNDNLTLFGLNVSVGIRY